ncbi:hypothetical protein CERZMDRAFT_95617 [Cercospora zeae-maydis SCOH1-5]|uniref:Uncharacterized protein n=1 Tax=Cercospora zeae-maydis SCOH1-5 TaxID=717836 RepID=A0A6A6FM09_9PEZI|nr:hypothetical protein CERZMDRAFT_95617 [Cercospora zeae-maydis SCOH1-5]
MTVPGRTPVHPGPKQETEEPASSESAFTFFNISHPSEARSSQYRRKVRSNVTKQQHRSRRPLTTAKSFRPFQPDAKIVPSSTKRECVAVEHVDSQGPPDAAREPPESSHGSRDGIRTSRTPTADSSPSTRPDTESDSPHLSHPPVHSIKRELTPSQQFDPVSATCPSRPEHEKRRKISRTFIDETNIGLNVSKTKEATTPEQPPSTRDVVLPQRLPTPESLSVARHDPFNSYSTPWQPWYDGLLHYMMTIFAPRAWPTLKITSAEGMKWETFMTQHAMQEPALFYVRLLFASGELVQSGFLRRERSHWLQAQAIKVINEALSDPARSISDGLILAVGRIALHECMYGNRDAANHIHRPAQRRMIDLRGGMKELNFPPLVKRLMRWSDRVMSMYGNTERMLPDTDDSDGGTYGLKQSLNAFEVWAPEPGKALRKRIAIDDLVN